MSELTALPTAILNINDEFNDQLAAELGDSIDDALSNVPDSAIEDLADAYSERAQHFETRFRTREMLISLFTNGALTEESHWDLLEVLSFESAPGGPADLFVWQTSDGDTITLVTLTDIETPETVYDNLQNLCQHITDNIDPISQTMADRQGTAGSDSALPLNDDGIEGAIVISNTDPAATVTSLDRASDDTPVSLWKFDGPDNEEISVVSDLTVDDWDWHVPDGRLGTLLEQGQAFADRLQASIDRFPDSHHERLFKQLPAYLHQQHAGGNKRWYCSEDEIVEFLTNSWTDPNRDDVRERAQALIDWWTHIDALETPSSSADRYDDDATVYKLANYHGRKTDPTDAWEDTVKPYRKDTARAIMRASEQAQHLSDLSELPDLIANARDHLEQPETSPSQD